MTDNTQPEALRLAKALEYCDASVARQAINELRRQHTRIAELEAQLEAIGAGGVSGPLMGRTPLAASAVSEPVAHLRQHSETGRTRVVMPDMIVDADASWRLVGPLFLGSPPSPPEGMLGGWIALPGALPEPGVPVLLDIGKKYPIRAMWAAKHTVQAADDDTDWGEYVEADDMYYAPEGWYEWNECEDNHWRVTETPRAWAPLPPTTSAGSGKGE